MESEPAPHLTHYGNWDALVHAVYSGSIEWTHRESRDLTLGEPIESMNPRALSAVDSLGASLGFLQVSRDRDDLGLGLTRAATSCGACHEVLTTEAPANRPLWAHETALEWAIDGLVWNRSGRAPDGVGMEADLARAYNSPKTMRSDTGKTAPVKPGDRLDGLLRECWRCHIPQ